VEALFYLNGKTEPIQSPVGSEKAFLPKRMFLKTPPHILQYTGEFGDLPEMPICYLFLFLRTAEIKLGS
jgi:hypothetical protein